MIDVDGLRRRVAELESQHANLVLRNKLLRDRKDLPAERLAVHDQVERRFEQYEERLAIAERRILDLQRELAQAIAARRAGW